VLNTVVRQFNRVVMDTTIGVTSRVLSVAVRGDEEVMSRAGMQWDGVRNFVERHPYRSWNPFFFLDKEMIEELQGDLANAVHLWEKEQHTKSLAPAASEPMAVDDLEALRAKVRKAMEANSTRRVSMDTGKIITDFHALADLRDSLRNGNAS
jgi:hypothetical protein